MVCANLVAAFSAMFFIDSKNEETVARKAEKLDIELTAAIRMTSKNSFTKLLANRMGC